MLEDLSEEALLEGMDSRGNQPIGTIIGGRLQPVVATPVRDCGAQVPTVQVRGHNLRGEPVAELVLVTDLNGSEPEKCPNQFAIPLAAATLQVIVEPGRRRARQLFPNKRQDRAGDIPVVSREACVDLKKLQQDRNAHPPPLRAVGEERLLGLEQRPVLDQFLLVPASFHRVATSLS